LATLARVKSFAGSHKLALFATVYFSTSALLSLSIFIRLLVLPTTLTKYANAVLYYLNYYILSWAGSVVFILAFLSQMPRIKRQSQKWKMASLAPFAVCLIAVEFSLMMMGIPDYFSTISLVPVATVLYLAPCRPKTNLSRRKVTLFLALLITASFLLPQATAYVCQNAVLSQASIKTPSEKASFISNLVANTNFNSPYFMNLGLRASNDFQKYVMDGVGACGEMAMSASTFLNELRLNARVVNLPGEDHAFVEVNLNGTWMVVDPGYYGSQILTREQRATDRVKEMGAISYVIAYVNSSFIELTQEYVPTDTIIIRVTNNGEPLTNAQIYLEHTFMGGQCRLPDDTHVFYTGINGTVTLHLGSMNYNANAGSTDSFYRVYVNGINTGDAVTSTGTGKTQFIEIDLTKL
jgi:hypothetical protein